MCDTNMALGNHYETYIIQKRRPGRPRKSLAQVLSYGSRQRLRDGCSRGGGAAYLADFQRKVEEKRNKLLPPLSADNSSKSDVAGCASDVDASLKSEKNLTAEESGSEHQKLEKLSRRSGGNIGVKQQSKSPRKCAGPSTPPQQQCRDSLDMRLSAEDRSPIIYSPSTAEKPVRRKRTKMMNGSGGEELSRKRPRTLNTLSKDDAGNVRGGAGRSDTILKMEAEIPAGGGGGSERKEVTAPTTPSGPTKSIMMTLLMLGDHYRRQMSAIYASEK